MKLKNSIFLRATLLGAALGVASINVQRCDEHCDQAHKRADDAPAEIGVKTARRCKAAILRGERLSASEDGGFRYEEVHNEYVDSCDMKAGGRKNGLLGGRSLTWKRQAMGKPIMQLKIGQGDGITNDVVLLRAVDSSEDGHINIECRKAEARAGMLSCVDANSGAARFTACGVGTVSVSRISEELNAQLNAIAAFEDDVRGK